MATRKQSRSTRRVVAEPVAAEFVRVLEEELATPAAVDAAYQQAVREWRAASGPVRAEVATDRPSPESPSDEARLIVLHRRLMFDGPDLGRMA